MTMTTESQDIKHVAAINSNLNNESATIKTLETNNEGIEVIKIGNMDQINNLNRP